MRSPQGEALCKRSAGVVCLAAAILGLLTSCTLAGGQSMAPGRIVVGMPWEPRSFDPFNSVDSASYYAQSLIYEGLVRFGPDLQVEGSLAERFEVLDGGRRYRFVLKKASFSDGVPVKSSDVSASVAAALGKKSPFRRNYDVIDKCLVVDDATIEMGLKRPDLTLPERLTELKILPERVLELSDQERGLARHPVGTGPYRLGKWIPGVQIEFEPNHAYHGDREQDVERQKIVWRVIPDKREIAMALVRKEIDLAQIDGRDAKVLAGSGPDLVIENAPGSRTIFLGFNTSEWPFDQKRVRQALSMMVNRDEIADKLYGGYCVVPRTDFPEEAARDAEIKSWPYDPEAAAKLLESEGFVRDSDGAWSSPSPANGRDRLSMRILTLRDFLDVAQAVASFLQKSGVLCEVSVVEYATLKDQYLKKGDFDVVLFSRTVGPWPDFRMVWSSTGSLNYSKFHSYELDSSIRLAIEAGDKKTMERYCRDVRRILAEEQPWIFLAQPRLLLVHQPWVQGVQPKVSRNGSRRCLPWDNPFFNARFWRRGD